MYSQTAIIGLFVPKRLSSVDCAYDKNSDDIVHCKQTLKWISDGNGDDDADQNDYSHSPVFDHRLLDSTN